MLVHTLYIHTWPMHDGKEIAGSRHTILVMGRPGVAAALRRFRANGARLRLVLRGRAWTTGTLHVRASAYPGA